MIKIVNKRKINKISDCKTPPSITKGTYNETLVENYHQGQIINGFYCDSGFLPFPSDGFIECGTNGWLVNGTCKLGKSCCL